MALLNVDLEATDEKNSSRIQNHEAIFSQKFTAMSNKSC